MHTFKEVYEGFIAVGVPERVKTDDSAFISSATGTVRATLLPNQRQQVNESEKFSQDEHAAVVLDAEPGRSYHAFTAHVYL